MHQTLSNNLTSMENQLTDKIPEKNCLSKTNFNNLFFGKLDVTPFRNFGNLFLRPEDERGCFSKPATQYSFPNTNNPILEDNSNDAFHVPDSEIPNSESKPVKLQYFYNDRAKTILNLPKPIEHSSILLEEFPKIDKRPTYHTFKLKAKRKFRQIGTSALYEFYEGNDLLYEAIQSPHEKGVFEIIAHQKNKERQQFPLDSFSNQRRRTSQSIVAASNLLTKKQAISTSMKLDDISISGNRIIASLSMLDEKGSEFILDIGHKNKTPLLNVQFISTDHKNVYREAVVTFFLTKMSQTSTLRPYDSSSPSAEKVQRLRSQMPSFDAAGQARFTFNENKFYLESIKNMNLYNRHQNKVYLSIRKTNMDELEIDTFLQTNALWLFAIALSDEISTVH